MEPSDRRKRSDAARSRSTRERILQAAVDCLIDDGYAATSIGAIQARAGVSRGALLHQYPNKALLLVDAVRHLSDRQLAEVAPTAGSDWLLVLWERFTTPLFGALLELWVAARTDSDLRKALLVHQRDLHRSVQAFTVEHLDAGDARNFDLAFDMTLTYYRGLALTEILSTAKRERLLAAWRRTIEGMLRTTVS